MRTVTTTIVGTVLRSICCGTKLGGFPQEDEGNTFVPILSSLGHLLLSDLYFYFYATSFPLGYVQILTHVSLHSEWSFGAPVASSASIKIYVVDMIEI